MPSDQLKMYEYAINVAQLLSSDLPEDDATVRIDNLVVSQIDPCCKTLSQRIQREAVNLAWKALSLGTHIHVPAILRSASVEFHTAFCPGGSQTPQIKRICENDTRVKARFWCPPAVFPHHSGVFPQSFDQYPQSLLFFAAMPVVVLKLPEKACCTGPHCDCQRPRNAPTI
jgi:hypothetical protein